MDAAESKGFLYTILLEEPFKNQIIHIKKEKYDYTISYYVSHHFGMLIGDIMTCMSCHKTKCSKLLNNVSFIISLEGIS